MLSGSFTNIKLSNKQIHIPKRLMCFLFPFLLLISCNQNENDQITDQIKQPANVLDFTGVPVSPADRNSLIFSDQGAWFAYGLPDTNKYYGGFTGPFLMTEENGLWGSVELSQLVFVGKGSDILSGLENFTVVQNAYLSHLEQVFNNRNLKITQNLFFPSPLTAMIITEIRNATEVSIEITPAWKGNVFLKGLHLIRKGNRIEIHSDNSPATGYIQIPGIQLSEQKINDTNYFVKLNTIRLDPGETTRLILSQSFIFPAYDSEKELQNALIIAKDPASALQNRIREKENQLVALYRKQKSPFNDRSYKNLMAKLVLTLQNNTRIPAGGIRHRGLFPSYHYKWFNGFWAWDSWKHAAAVAFYDPELAKDQIRAMYDYQQENGFLPDCIFRDTALNNYRDTKPPLSAWAVWKIFEADHDTGFVNEMFPKIKRQHSWWYAERDHDHDSICEYGSTDGTTVAARWESGMDNAVRFDHVKMLKNSTSAYSLNQESVDLNAYLYAEKIFLKKMAHLLNHEKDSTRYSREAARLKFKIREQFFDPVKGWFFDTSIDGKKQVEAMGCEGWIPLWAKIATPEQAEAVKNNMMNPGRFNTYVPFPTLSADHPDFQPDGGYWRGPVWIDQACFGIVGLRNYGYHQEATEVTYKLIHNAEGVMTKGKSIRENYNPVTGAGLEAENFSWSAAHYLLLLINE